MGSRMKENRFGLVSVVVPVYNAADHLRETLSSIYNQTYKSIEIIAVDDGSSDDSIDIARSFDGRVILVQQPNSGPAAARNRGVAEAKGEWIAFLDADDLWVPEKLEKQLHAMSNREWSYTDSRFMGGVNDGKQDSDLNEKPSGNVIEKLICGNFISTSSVLLRRNIFNEVGGFDENLRSIEDWDLWIRIASRYPISYVPDPLLKYRVHSISASRSTRKTLPNHLKVIDKAFSSEGVAAHLGHLKRSAKAKSLSICSQIAEEEKDYSFAFRCAVGAFAQQFWHATYADRMLKSTVKLVLYCIGVYGRS